jgi:hypothetical protein
MTGGLEVADIFRHEGPAWRAAHEGHLNRDQLKVMGAIAACRTAALGGHAERCGDCGHQRVAYNSCRNRHCPKCQAAARTQWLAERQAELLPVPYFHVVFTLPKDIGKIAFQNKATVYNILFAAAAETLRTIAADPKHLGAEIGVVAVLHSWGQALTHHPHLHCVVPGGGLAPDGERWVACRPRFFLPVPVLSCLFRRLFLERLRCAFDAGHLKFFAELAHLAEPAAFARLIRPLAKRCWVVYAKRPFGSPEQVLAYLGRYTHRVAITNSRLTAFENHRVTFRWKDYRHDHPRQQLMTLDADEFMRRFLLHVLPTGFHRIRHYGFLANGHRADKLALCRRLLQVQPEAETGAATTDDGVGQATRPPRAERLPPCPCCGGQMLSLGPIPRRPRNNCPLDTS